MPFDRQVDFRKLCPACLVDRYTKPRTIQQRRQPTPLVTHGVIDDRAGYKWVQPGEAHRKLNEEGGVVGLFACAGHDRL